VLAEACYNILKSTSGVTYGIRCLGDGAIGSLFGSGHSTARDLLVCGIDALELNQQLKEFTISAGASPRRFLVKIAAAVKLI
jgi:hypothetical protein